MTKRTGGVFSDELSKKFKADKLDELWGDDLDERDIDDCFLLASQAYQEGHNACTQRNNVSILPSYSAFKALSRVSTSTQASQQISSLMRTRSHDTGTVSESRDLLAQIRQLKEQSLAREGEASILRSQLKELRGQSEREYAKRQTEWDEKLTAIKKQLTSTESELQFKNLQIVSLKQQVEAAKSDSLTRAFTQSFVEPKNPDASELPKSTLLVFPLFPKEYPLRNAFPPGLFEYPCHEDHLPTEETHGQDINIGLIHSLLRKLSDTEQEAINDVESHACILKITNIVESLVETLRRHLAEKAEQNVEVFRNYEETPRDFKREFDELNTSLFSSNAWCKNEIGINLRQGLLAVASIVSVSCHLQAYFNNEVSWPSKLLLLVQLIKQTGNFEVFRGVLSSTVVLLTEIVFNCEQLDKHCDIIANLIREILLCKPNVIEVYKMFDLFKCASTNRTLTERLYTISFPNKAKSSNNKSRATVQNLCALQLLCIRADEIVSQLQISEQFYLKLVEFCLALLHKNPRWWSENERCGCFKKLVQLVIKVVHKVIKEYSDDCNELLHSRKELRKQIIIDGIHVLHVLNYKAYETLLKNIATFSQYKAILQKLNDIKDDLALGETTETIYQQLNITEDVVSVVEEKIGNFCLWEED